jgi:hypothetical protein
MDQTGFDDLARVLSTGVGSRRRALQLAAAAVVGAPLLTLFPDSAAGSGKKRCKKKHGVYLTSGECTCGVHRHKGQDPYWKFRCADSAGCACFESVDGSGICARYNVVANHQGCESDAVCDPGSRCTILSGGSCKENSTCPDSQFNCVNGTCQYSICRPACSS